MTRLVVMAGDWAQLAFPQSEPLCLWPKMKRAKNDLHVDRLRALNGFAAHERVPQSAYLRSTGDVVEFVHTQRFRNDDGHPIVPGSNVRNLLTVDPHGTQPTLLRRMREGVLVNGSEEEVKEAVHLAHEVFGEHRQTPADTRHIAIQWDFIQGLNARLVRTLAARQDPVQMVYTFAAHDVELPGATPFTPDERRILRHHPNPNKTAGRPGVLSVFAGLHVELTEKKEDMGWTADGSPERRDGEVLPLLPTSGLTPYTAQGLTADWALLHVDRVARESIYSWWYKLYFFRALFVGPEPHIVAELARLRDRATKTRPKIAAIARAMGWPAPGAELAAWRKERGVVEHPGWGAAYDAEEWWKPLPPTGASSIPPPPAAPTPRAAAPSAAAPQAAAAAAPVPPVDDDQLGNTCYLATALQCLLSLQSQCPDDVEIRFIERAACFEVAGVKNDCSGYYAPMPLQKVNDQPWIFADRESMSSGGGWCISSKKHGGALPHLAGKWKQTWMAKKSDDGIKKGHFIAPQIIGDGVSTGAPLHDVSRNEQKNVDGTRTYVAMRVREGLGGTGPCWGAEEKSFVGPPRDVRVGVPDPTQASNKVRLAKWWNFLPKNLFEQFHRIANCYFLCLVILNWLPFLQVFARVASMLPLLAILTFTACKRDCGLDAYEDWRRHKEQRRRWGACGNRKQAEVLRNGKFVDDESGNILREGRGPAAGRPRACAQLSWGRYTHGAMGGHWQVYNRGALSRVLLLLAPSPAIPRPPPMARVWLGVR
eukprot:gene33465-8181_t